MANTMTKKEKFEMLKGIVADNEMLVEFIDHEIELLSRKRTNSKPTKTQLENLAILELIKGVFAGNGNKPMTIGELAKVDTLSQHSTNKINAIVSQNTEGTKMNAKVGIEPCFKRVEEKGSAKFSLIG